MTRTRIRLTAPILLVILGLLAVVWAPAGWPAPLDPAPSPTPGVNASFEFDPAAPKTGDTVTFDSTSDVWGDGNQIVSYEWDLDGNGSFETTGPPPVSRSYSTRRSIEVRLRVTDASQPPNTDVSSHRIKIADRPPVASFRWSPIVPHANEPVAFTSTASDVDGKLVEQAWDLDGDGKFDNGGGGTALRSFAAPGTYLVGLRVTDDDGSVSSVSLPIAVAPGAAGSGTLGAAQKNGIRLMNPFPIVRIAGRYVRGGARIKLLVVDAPRGAKVSIHCSGRGCPFKKAVRPAARVRVKKLERVLRAGAIVRVYVTQRGTIGKYTRVKIRAGKAPARTDLCLPPESWHPIKCPGL